MQLVAEAFNVLNRANVRDVETILLCASISECHDDLAAYNPSVKRFDGLPGAELVEAGLRDLASETITPAALLVSIGAPHLRLLGVEIPRAEADPEHRLYLLLAAEDPDAAHGRYNALVRRLVSFERALACVA